MVNVTSKLINSINSNDFCFSRINLKVVVTPNVRVRVSERKKNHEYDFGVTIRC